MVYVPVLVPLVPLVLLVLLLPLPAELLQEPVEQVLELMWPWAGREQRAVRQMEMHLVPLSCGPETQLHENAIG